jgi:hypothetical protein
LPELSREVSGVLEGLLRDAGDAAAAAAEAAIEATAPGAGEALARPEVAQLLRTDPLYRAAVEGAGGPVSPEEMEAYFAVRRGRRCRHAVRAPWQAAQTLGTRGAALALAPLLPRGPHACSSPVEETWPGAH